MCEVLGVSRSGYYRWFSLREELTEKQNRLNSAVLGSWTDSYKLYGSRRIARDIRSEKNISLSKDTISSIMKHLDIVSFYQRKKFRKAYKRGEITEYPQNLLNREFNPEAVNQVWGSDTTFIRSKEGWLHLCVVIDLFSRKVIGWSLDKRNNSELVKSALREALFRRGYPKGVIFHSDRGSEYSSYFIQKILKDNHFIVSMSRKGNCWDNAVVESFFKTLKTELINRINSRKLDLIEVKKECFDYIEGFYNTRRIHSALDNKSPQEYEK